MTVRQSSFVSVRSPLVHVHGVLSVRFVLPLDVVVVMRSSSPFKYC
jgi:hypothetical protein